MKPKVYMVLSFLGVVLTLQCIYAFREEGYKTYDRSSLRYQNTLLFFNCKNPSTFTISSKGHEKHQLISSKKHNSSQTNFSSACGLENVHKSCDCRNSTLHWAVSGYRSTINLHNLGARGWSSADI